MVQEGTATGVERIDTGLGSVQEKLQRVNAGLSVANETDLDPAVTALSATVVSVNNALQALDDMPFVSVPTLDTDRLQALSVRAQTSLATVAAAGQSAQATTVGLEEQVAVARAQVQSVGSAAERWIDRAVIGLTMLLLWIALANASLLRSAWRYTRSRA